MVSMTLRGRQRGVTYLALLLAIAMMGAILGAVGEVSRTVQQREREKELLFVGNEYRRAIGLYYQRTPGPAKQFPRSLEVLLLDDRYPGVQRYLRKLYRDPITDSSDWGLFKTPDGAIMGVYSRSEAAPIKVAGFVGRNAEFEGATQYSAWKFVTNAAAPAPALAKRPLPATPAATPDAVPPSGPQTPTR